MKPFLTRLKISALAAPVLLLVYGVLRLIDDRYGGIGPGPAWNAGHTAFLIAFVLFGILIVELRRLVHPAGGAHSVVAAVAAVAAELGVLAFLVVIVGDLIPSFARAVSLPDPVMVAGPLLFELGTFVLLLQLVLLQPRRLPVWSLGAVLVGFVLIGVNLDLLPLSGVLILAGLAPLARKTRNGKAGDVERPGTMLPTAGA